MSEEETFKVTDRRRRLGDDPAPGPARASDPPADLDPRPVPAEIPTETGAEAVEGGPDLQGLLMMFETSALVGLGAEPDPVTGERRIDLDQAQEAIETLLLLRVKTQGNRTAAESGLLDDMLQDLRARFLGLVEEIDPGLR